jgi:hypothetical protein
MAAITIPNMLLIAGTGRNSGKTMLACNIIRNFSRSYPIIAIKISPHFHKKTVCGRVLINRNELFIAEEKDSATAKDSSRMLQAGATRSIFIMTTDRLMERVIHPIRKLLPPGALIVCESGGLRHWVKPGLFLMTSRDDQDNPDPAKEIFKNKADCLVRFDGDHVDFDPGKITIEDNSWKLKKT